MGATSGKYTDHVCVDIYYINRWGNSVQSDLCYDKTNLTPTHRKVLHEALDEWLDKANGTGQFRLWHEDTMLAEVEYNEDIHPYKETP